MKKLVLVGLLALALLATSCGGSNFVSPTPTPYIPTGQEPPETVTWISPGKVQVGNFFPGARAEWPLTIHNGNDETTPFIVKYRYPDRVDTGYNFPTPEVQTWVIIADTTPVLAPRETREILITLAMPSGATAPGTKWEFWLGVSENTGGMVVAQMCSRWQIIMQ